MRYIMEKIDKLYTKEEVLSCLVSKAKEELSDVISYNLLYESLKSHEMCDDAEEIEHIANQEYRHAKTIFELLMERGYDIHDNAEIMSLLRKVKEIFDEE